MKKSFLVVTVLLLLLNFSSVVLASPDIRFEQDYDFRKIKKLLVLEPVFSAENMEEGLKKELKEVFFQNAKLKKVKILNYDDVLLSIQIDTGIDFIELKKEQPEEAKRLFLEHASKYVDAILYTDVPQYKEGTRFVEATTRTETYYEKRGSYDSKGKWVVRDYPVRRTYHVPAHDQITLTTKMEIVLFDLKKEKEVLWYSDYRYREPGMFASKTPINMYERTLRNFWSQMKKQF